MLLLSPTIPLLFMGEEWGTRTPFLFFTDHNDDLAELVREGRRREFAHFAAFQDEARRAQIPDPNAATTFAASVPDMAEAERAPMLALYRTLLAIRHTYVVPGIPGCRSAGAAAIGSSAVRGGWHLGNGTLLTIAVNFGDAPVAIQAMPGQVIYQSAEQSADGALPPRSAMVTLVPAS